MLGYQVLSTATHVAVASLQLPCFKQHLTIDTMMAAVTHTCILLHVT
jgi:hypothetical protein